LFGCHGSNCWRGCHLSEDITLVRTLLVQMRPGVNFILANALMVLTKYSLVVGYTITANSIFLFRGFSHLATQKK